MRNQQERLPANNKRSVAERLFTSGGLGVNSKAPDPARISNPSYGWEQNELEWPQLNCIATRVTPNQRTPTLSIYGRVYDSVTMGPPLRYGLKRMKNADADARCGRDCCCSMCL